MPFFHRLGDYSAAVSGVPARDERKDVQDPHEALPWGAVMASPARSARHAASTEVSAVVVSFNSRTVLEPCLTSLSGSVAETIVVDSASTDGSAALVRDRFPDAVVIALDANLGYGAAANQGLLHAAHDYVLVVNADVRAEPGAVAELLACGAAAPRAAALGPQLVGTDGSPQVSVLPFPTVLWRGRPAVTSWPMHRNRAPRRLRRRVFPVGAALLLRRDRVLEVGGFDPAFFMYSEESDLCYRLLRGGWSIEHCPRSRFVHVGGASTSADRARLYREQLRSHLRYMRKHHGRAAAAASHVVLVAALAARSLRNHRDPHDPAAALRWLVSARTQTLLTETAEGRGT